MGVYRAEPESQTSVRNLNFDHHLHPNPVAMSNTTNTNTTTTDAAIHALTVQLATELGLSPDLGLAALYAERDRRNRAAEKKRKREEAEKKKRAEVARVPAR